MYNTGKKRVQALEQVHAIKIFFLMKGACIVGREKVHVVVSSFM
jgi:hypothetical protein